MTGEQKRGEGLRDLPLGGGTIGLGRVTEKP